MRTAKVEVLSARASTPLVVRGRIERAFLGLGLFSAIGVLVYGAHLLVKAMMDPLEASEMTVLGAGFTLSLSSFAITYLLWPRGRRVGDRREDSLAYDDDFEANDGSVLTIYEETLEDPSDPKRILAERGHLPGSM